MAICAPTCGCAIQTETLALSGSGSAADPWVINSALDPAIADLQSQIDTINATLLDDQQIVSDLTDEVRAGTVFGKRLGLAAASPSTTTLVFDNIPQTFTHLMVVGSLRHSNSSAANVFRQLQCRFNGDASPDYYSSVHGEEVNRATSDIVGNGLSSLRVGWVGDNYAGGFQMWLGDYTGGSVFKSWNTQGTAMIGNPPTPTGNYVRFNGMGGWANSAPITKIEFIIGNDPFVTPGTRLSLYGLK